MKHNNNNNKLKMFWFESKSAGDFPLYNDQPFTLSWPKWIWWLVFTIGSFVIFTGVYLYLIQIFDADIFNQFKDALISKPWLPSLFVIIGYLMLLGSYAVITKHHWSILFRKLNKKAFFFAVIFGLILFVISLFYYEFVLVELLHINLNDNSAVSVGGKTGVSILSAFSIIIQLLAEEFWTILPFLFILRLCFKTFNISRKTSIIFAWIISSIIFGIYHIPSYDGNLAQVFLVVTVDRLFITFVYLRYKSICASYLTHVAWDIIPIIVAIVKFSMG